MKKKFTPNIKAAVRELVYMIESEGAKRSNKQNMETILACLSALNALIGSRYINKAKEFLEK